jgi:hypothetical protein
VAITLGRKPPGASWLFGCHLCAKATKAAAEKAYRENTGMNTSLPGPFGKCLGGSGGEFLARAAAEGEGS